VHYLRNSNAAMSLIDKDSHSSEGSTGKTTDDDTPFSYGTLGEDPWFVKDNMEVIEMMN
jgi:hypothetical protein